MKKLTLAILLTLASSIAFADEITGQLIHNETSIEQACKEIYMADIRCHDINDYVFAAVVVSSKQAQLDNDTEVDAVAAIVKKADFARLEGKTVKAKYSPGQFAEVIEN